MTDHDHTLDSITEGAFADALPRMDDDAFDRLVTSIEKDGYDDAEPIVVTPDGEIVDGHHRYRACVEADAAVSPAIVEKDDATLEYAIRKNLSRRDHSSGQKRAVVVSYLTSEQHDETMSQRDIADALGVSIGTVSNAMKEAFPERYEDDDDDEEPENVAKRSRVEHRTGATPDEGGTHSVNTDEASGESESSTVDAPEDVSDTEEKDTSEDGAPEPVAEDVTPPGDTLDSDEDPPLTDRYDDHPLAGGTPPELIDAFEQVSELTGMDAETINERLSQPTSEADTERMRDLVNRVDELEQQNERLRSHAEDLRTRLDRAITAHEQLNFEKVSAVFDESEDIVDYDIEEI